MDTLLALRVQFSKSRVSPLDLKVPRLEPSPRTWNKRGVVSMRRGVESLDMRRVVIRKIMQYVYAVAISFGRLLHSHAHATSVEQRLPDNSKKDGIVDA